jgi:hypothetical protein
MSIAAKRNLKTLFQRVLRKTTLLAAPPALLISLSIFRNATRKPA